MGKGKKFLFSRGGLVMKMKKMHLRH